MELLDDNMNSHESENFNSSGLTLHGFTAMSGDSFSNHYHHHPHADLSNFNFIVNQSGSVYDPMNLFPTTVEAFDLQHDGVGTRVESFMNLDPPVFAPGLIIRETKGYGGKKRKKNNQSGVEKPREVVHVRAKRGEATDSHSLAERSRREKINEKLKRLQEQVPGCYKTMGMSVMLDVIINYVRSLHNQIEFLSMKLQAASMFYDFNSTDTDVIDTMKGTNRDETQVMERMVEEGYGDLPRF